MSSQESDIEEKLVDLDIDEDKISFDVINILLLGETGVGKSTLINAIANYLTYKYFDIAEKNNLIVLVPSIFGIQDKHKKDHKIKIGTDSDVNEYLETGVSATQDVKTYLFPIWKGKVKVRIIDTPGLGDTRGIQQDEKNCHNVLKYVSKLDYLHGICFLFKPTEARKTMFFEYCFSQLLCHLDKLACNKLFFVFTKTRGANYGATETLNILEEVISEIKKYSPDVNIPLLLDTNVFCFDNEGFRYLAAQQQNIEFSEDDKNNYKKSWKTSVKSWWNLIKSVRRCNQMPYTPKNIAALTNGRNEIRCFSNVLSQISDNIRDNDIVLHKLLLNRDSDMFELEELKSRHKRKVTVVYKEHKPKPSLVCTASSCIDTYKVGSDTQLHYKTICHSECDEIFTAEKNVIGHPQFVNCYVINNITRQCSHCKCDFSVHLLIDYQTVIKEGDVIDEDILKQITTKEALLRSSLDVINEYQRKSYNLKQEYDLIREVCHKMASFIRQIAVIPFNYCYGEYVEQCIRTEQSNQHSNSIVLESYRKLLRENKELNTIFEDALMTNEAVSLLDSDISLEEIEGRYEQLFSLKFSGYRIKELLNKDQTLIENDNGISEYVHNIKFDYKKERKNKDKSKEKTTKKENYDSDTNSVTEKKERKNKKNKTNKLKRNDNRDENYDSDASSKKNNYNNHNKDNRKRGIEKTNPNKSHPSQYDGKTGGTNNMDNTQRRSLTPPPPYSHIWTPSKASQSNLDNNLSHPYSNLQNFPLNQERNNLTARDNQFNDNKYEITVSIKERNKNPSSGFLPNTGHSSSYNEGFLHRPPMPPESHIPSVPVEANRVFPSNNAAFPHPNSRYGPRAPYVPYDPRYAQQDPKHVPHDPRYGTYGPKYAPQGPRYAPQGPRYAPQGPRYAPQGPRYALHGPRYVPPNPQYAPYGPRYPQENPRFPPSNPGYPLGSSLFPEPPPPYSFVPRRADESVDRQQNRTHNEQHGKGNNANKKGKSKKENSNDTKNKNLSKSDHNGGKDRSKKK